MLRLKHLNENKDSETIYGDSQMKFLGNVFVFAILYVLFMLPTYFLPYFGSNSSVINSIAASSDTVVNSNFWLHLGSLLVLIVIAFFRGTLIDKKWLVIFPILGSIFDLIPVLNSIPLIPTLMHLLAIILGVIGYKSISQEIHQQA